MATLHHRGVYEYPKGSGKFWIQFFVNGRRRRESVGPLKLAIAVRERRMTEIREGKFFPELARQTIRFDTLCEDFRKQRPTHWSKGLLDTCERWFAGQLAGNVTPHAIDLRLNRLIEDGRAPATANRYRAILSAIFSTAMKNGKAISNPARLVDLRQENNGRIRYLSEAEERSIREVIRAKCWAREPEFDLALNTGMRRGEQYGLTWQDVDVNRALITLIRTKSGRVRHIPLNTSAVSAVQLLRQYSKRRKKVCDAQGGWFKQVTKLAGVRNLRWHDLRHTFASRLTMAGADLRTIQELMGHESIAMTARYAHLASSHLQDAIEKIAKPVDGQLRVAGRNQ